MGYVSPSLSFDDHKASFYCTETSFGGTEDALVFTIYLELKNLKDETGEVFPKFYLVFTCTLQGAASGHVMPIYQVTVMHNFVTPGKFSPGKEVTSPGEAANQIGLLLDLENINTAVGIKPHGVDPKSIKKENLRVGQMVYKVTVEPSTFIFDLIKGLDKTQASQTGIALFQDMKGILAHIKKAQLRQKTSLISGRYQIRFTLVNLAEKDELSIDDLDFLSDHFDLSEEKIRKIVRVIND